MYFWLHISLLTVLFSALGFGGGSMYKDILCLLFVSTIVDEKWKYLILLYCVHQGSREDYYQMQNKEKTLHFPHFPIFVIFLIILSSNYQWATVKAQYVTAVFYSFFSDLCHGHHQNNGHRCICSCFLNWKWSMDIILGLSVITS